MLEVVRIDCSPESSEESSWGVDLTLQRCRDTLWLTLRDDEAQTHGTVCRGQLSSESLLPEDTAGLLGTSSAEVDVLLGDREDPLINILSSAIARQCAAVTPLPPLMCIALGKLTKERLSTGERRRQFIASVLNALNQMLLTSSGGSHSNDERRMTTYS